MNTGLQDAHHLAHLLADISAGHLEESALDRYESERRPVAMTLIPATDRAFGIIARPGRGTGFLRRRARDVLAVLAPRILATDLGPYLAGLLGQYRIRYHAVPEGEPLPRWARDRAVGLRLPPSEENRAVLREMSWQLHTYGTDAARPTGLPDWIQGPSPSPSIRGAGCAGIGCTWCGPMRSSRRRGRCTPGRWRWMTCGRRSRRTGCGSRWGERGARMRGARGCGTREGERALSGVLLALAGILAPPS